MAQPTHHPTAVAVMDAWLARAREKIRRTLAEPGPPCY